MTFNLSRLDASLPNYLTETDKDRLKKGLEQFKIQSNRGKSTEWSPKFYTNFFLEKINPYFLQGDLVREIRTSNWDYHTNNYEAIYPDVIVISSTCDIEFETKSRNIDKQILFAPIISYNEYLSDLESDIEFSKKVDIIARGIKNQEYSNIFYLPANSNNGLEYIALLDQIFWFPSTEFNSYTNSIERRRIISLDYYGFYLFVLKLSYHLCRLPEDQHRT